MNKVNVEIGKALTKLMEDKKVKDYHLHTTLSICTSPILTRIKRGTNKTATNFPVIMEIYRAMGEKEINISNEGVRLLVKL
jgi:hypothetical protein